MTPYNGSNLGDAAIQDAIIANLRLRLVDAEFSGITLNDESFLNRHGNRAFPLTSRRGTFYGMSSPDRHTNQTEAAVQRSTFKELSANALKAVPLMRKCLRAIYVWLDGIGREFKHCVDGYRFLRTQDILIVSGGGQLDEEWGGAWGHPFALFKWGALARIARIPFAVVSVGAGKTTSPFSRLFLSLALRMATYRSYRDKHTRKIAEGLWEPAADDSVVPDAAFGVPTSEFSTSSRIGSLAQGRIVVAISPIAFAKPGHWPRGNQSLYDRYVQQMAIVVLTLLERGYFVVMLSSSLGADKTVIQEILGRLKDESKKQFALQLFIPEITNWRDLTASLSNADILIASRLHSAILGFRAEKPVVAISFDPKIEWLMEDLGQSEFISHIQSFLAEDVVRLLDKLVLLKDKVSEQIASYQQQAFFLQIAQYDTLADLAIAQYRMNLRPTHTAA